MREQLLVLVGPTACGKTGVSIQLAQHLNGEIISADSVAVYHGFDIGSARPTVEEQAGIRHHLLDCVSCDDVSFSVARFKELATAAIDDVLSRNRLPILVGGSGLYVDAVTAPMSYAVQMDPALRTELNAAYQLDPNAFHGRLQALDPETATRLHVHDQKRLVRAMEIVLLTGQPMSALTKAYVSQQQRRGRYTCRKIGLSLPREELYRRIDARVDSMMRTGLLQEAKAIYDKGLPRMLPAMRSIGYAQLFDYFDGRTTLPDAVEAIKRDTRRFAKRQLTWFRRDASITWFDREQYTDEAQLLQAILCELEEESR